jgi:hypothetical protein
MQIAGRLPLLREGRVPATLRDFELEGDTIEFTLEVALSPPLLSGLADSASLFGSSVFSSPPDAVLRVSWAQGMADEAGLHVPARNQAIATGRVRLGQPPGQPELHPIRCAIEGTRWQQRLSFGPLPDDGELTFRLTSRLLDITNSVGVVPVAHLRARLI